MAPVIQTIRLDLILKLGTVNCYLVQSDRGCILIDSGPAQQRAALERALDNAGCAPGNLKLILLTHGDFDHTGNAAFLRQKFGAKIAMHPGDAGMLERGDMFSNRKNGNAFLRWIAPPMFGFGKAQRCTPDIALEDGFSLADYGLVARVIHLPGHSAGSVAVLTAQGDLFCGDLIDNTKEPALNSIIDDAQLAAASIEKLSGLSLQTIYPGHGGAFAAATFFATLKPAAAP